MHSAPGCSSTPPSWRSCMASPGSTQVKANFNSVVAGRRAAFDSIDSFNEQSVMFRDHAAEISGMVVRSWSSRHDVRWRMRIDWRCKRRIAPILGSVGQAASRCCC